MKFIDDLKKRKKQGAAKPFCKRINTYRNGHFLYFRIKIFWARGFFSGYSVWKWVCDVKVFVLSHQNRTPMRTATCLFWKQELYCVRKVWTIKFLCKLCLALFVLNTHKPLFFYQPFFEIDTKNNPIEIHISVSSFRPQW